MDIITAQSIKKYFQEGVRLTKALDGVSLSIEKGSFTAITGPSGCGKTTLLNIMGGLYAPTQGRIFVDGTDLSTLSQEQLTVFRRRKVGFVFQKDNLVPELTVKENILFPLALDDSRPDMDYFFRLVSLLGLKNRLDDFPYMLSGGMQQCAAIARALITKPAIVLADEPTGSFDIKTSQEVAGLLKMTAEAFHQSLIVVTHDHALAQLAHRSIVLKDGRIVSHGA